MGKMDIVDVLPESTWRSYVQCHPQGNIFHTPEMFEVFAQAKGHKPELWAAVDGENQPLALFLPVRISLAAGTLKKLTSRAVSYGSVLCNPDTTGTEALAALLEAYKGRVGRSVLFTELRNVSDLGPLQPVLAKTGFVYKENINFLIDLSCSKAELMARFGKRTRKHIRYALKNERMEVEEVTQKKNVETCYRLLKKSYARARVYLADLTLFESAFDVLTSQGMARFLLVRAEGYPVATSIELIFKDTITGWYGGIDRSFRRYNPNELLAWHIFEWGIDGGYRVYDFGGAGNPAQEYGVRDFKAKFKGEQVGFGRNVCVHNPALLKVSKLGYRLYQYLLPIKDFSIRQINRREENYGDKERGHRR